MSLIHTLAGWALTSACAVGLYAAVRLAAEWIAAPEPEAWSSARLRILAECEAAERGASYVTEGGALVAPAPAGGGPAEASL